LLIDMIWHGPLLDCADLAASAAIDPNLDESTRAGAVRALIACQNHEAIQRFVDEVLINTATWKNRPFCYLFEDIVPQYLSVDRFATLLKCIMSEGGLRSDLNSVLNQLVDKIAPLSSYATDLRNAFCQLIEEGIHEEIEEYHMTSSFGLFTEPLAKLCARQIEEGASLSDTLVRACVVASRFMSVDYNRSQEIENLSKILQRRLEFREAVYWEDAVMLDTLFPNSDWQYRAWRSSGDQALIGPLVSSDAIWLESALSSKRTETRRLALYQLLGIWRNTGRPRDLFARMRFATEGFSELTKIIDDACEPNEEPASIRRSKARIERRRQEAIAKEEERIAGWKIWRDTLRINPIKSFSGNEEESNVVNLIEWVSMHAKRQVSDGPWSSDAVALVLGEDVLIHALPALKKYWRKNRPLLWSERKPETRQTFVWAWMYGLCALKAEAAEARWIDQLSDDEVRLATKFAMIQFNGWPEFLDQLIASRPMPVLDILSRELEAQFNAWDEVDGDLPLLQSIRYGGEAVQCLLAPNLLGLLERWPQDLANADTGRPLHGLSQLIDILTNTNNVDDATRVRDIAREQFDAEPSGYYATLWLQAVFKLDFKTGVGLLTETFQNPENSSDKQTVLGLLAGIFGDRGSTPLPNLRTPYRAEILGKLLRFSHQFVKREDDRVHNGVFEPDTRDHAESARSAIFSALMETPGADARRVIIELTGDPQFSSVADRWRMLSLEQLAIQAEFEPYDINSIMDFEKCHEIAPRNSDELLFVTIGRLDDLAHDLHHHKFSLLKEWRNIVNEPDAQRLLAARLNDKRGNTYTAVTREEEVTELNRTDITLSTLGVDAKQTTIEIKIANRHRSINSLARDLEKQLVDKYLRHESCRAGCFLVINRGDRPNWQHPKTNKNVSFSDLIEYLESKAREIEERQAHGVQIAVFGLDLTNAGAARHSY